MPVSRAMEVVDPPCTGQPSKMASKARRYTGFIMENDLYNGRLALQLTCSSAPAGEDRPIHASNGLERCHALQSHSTTACAGAGRRAAAVQCQDTAAIL
ncbi:hypothetical protein U9M48_027227 [Paspalum notatum var. saurae]|uniref:Uncharacterized protein n=1 Tax=Paspalum notatum var. saurae TaxID=547442 RepID=A0AAQ3TW49_PASNO